MQEEQIKEISTNVKTFLARETKSSEKINKMEDKMNKMQSYFSRPDIGTDSNLEEKNAFNDYIRKGIKDGFVTKSFSGANDEGGMTITPDLSKQIISAINAKSPMRQLASIESISTRSLDIILEDGAFTSGWIGEVETRGDTATPALLKKTIHTHEIFAQPKATQSLIDDSEINIGNWLRERLVDSFVRLESESFIAGDGNNKPFGLLANGDIEQLDTEATVTPELLLALISSLDEGYVSNSHFLMNRNSLSAIQSLKDDTGRFIWQQSLSDPLKQTIFGVPVVISSHMPDIAEDALAIAFGDFKSAYKIVDRSEINLTIDPYTDKPFVKFYSTKRVGGDVVNPTAMKFAKFGA